MNIQSDIPVHGRSPFWTGQVTRLISRGSCLHLKENAICLESKCYSGSRSTPDCGRQPHNAYAVFPDTTSPRLKALSFGVHYAPDSLVITAYGPCIGDLNNGAGEYPGPGWPANDTGTAIVFQETQTDRLVECYWFAGYNYFENPTIFRLRDNPDSTLGGTFADDAVPSVQDPITDSGTLGFRTPGALVCPGGGGLDEPGGGGNDGPNDGNGTEDPTEDRQILVGHVPADIERLGLQPIGELPDTLRLHLAFGLPVRDRAALESLVNDLSDPESPNYRQYLSPSAFIELFSPSQQAYDLVTEFASSHGLSVTRTFPDRLVLEVEGSVADIESAFHLSLLTYNHPSENRVFFAPNTEPSVDRDLPLLSVEGLTDHGMARSPLHLMGHAEGGGGSGPEGSFLGYDFRHAYVPGTSFTGSGQRVGIYAYASGFVQSDIETYEDAMGLTRYVPLRAVLVGWDGSPGWANDEVSLDMEMAIAMAPGMAELVVYEGTAASTILDAMADDTSVKQFSCSFPFDLSPVGEELLLRIAAQGQSFFTTAGNLDAWLPNDHIYDTREFQFVTVAGGTELQMTGSGQSYASERVWNWSPVVCRESPPACVGTGGGSSDRYSIPSWQSTIDMTSNGGSTSMRNSPDVSMVAENVWMVYNYGTIDTTTAGTSIAAPLWAGFTALVNQQEVQHGWPAVGFLNPAVYALGAAARSDTYHDVTVGDNTWFDSPTRFYSAQGYDLCTGWGSPTNALLARLSYTGPGSVTAWGDDSDHQCEVSFPNILFRAVDGGDCFSFGLKDDGSLVAWGTDCHGAGVLEVPEGNGYSALAAGASFGLALWSDGRVVPWGGDECLQWYPPDPDARFVAISAGRCHSVGLKGNGSVVQWGYYDQSFVPLPNTGFMAVSAGDWHSLGLKSDGSVVAWGDSIGVPGHWWSPLPSPNSGFIALAAGGGHSLALKSDGTIVAWGDNTYGQCGPIPSNDHYVAIAAGGRHSLGLKDDGRIVGWGWNEYGQSDEPSPNGRFSVVAAGDRHSLGVRMGAGLAEVAERREPPARADELHLWPNPSYGLCRISFGLAGAGHVEAKIIGPTGRVVRRLYEGDSKPGTTSLVWDGRNDNGWEVPAGVYFACVKTASGATTKKAVLIRK